jgi:creatinine amidohydrolase/Fe(II)-dependent formamide hydrolase-like protein
MNFAELTAPEIRALPRDSTLIIAPIAAMEQDGPHLPVSTGFRTFCPIVTTVVDRRAASVR